MKPHNITLAPGVSNISVSWDHDNSCFKDHAFIFTVTWKMLDTRDNSIMNTTVNGTAVQIPGLRPGTKHSICVSAISTSDVGVLNKDCLDHRPSGREGV